LFFDRTNVSTLTEIKNAATSFSMIKK